MKKKVVGLNRGQLIIGLIVLVLGIIVCLMYLNNSVTGNSIIVDSGGISNIDGSECMPNIDVDEDGDGIQDRFYFKLKENIISSSDSPCFIIDVDDIIFDLNGFEIKGDGTGTGIFIDYDNGVENVVIKNGNISGFEKGIDFDDVSNNNLTDLIIKNNEIGIYLRGSDNLIKNNLLIDNSENGLLIIEGSNNLVKNNIIEDNGKGVSLELIDETNDVVCYEEEDLDCSLEDCDTLGYIGYTCNSNDSCVLECELGYECKEDILGGTDRQCYKMKTIEENTFFLNNFLSNDYGLYFDNADNNFIKGNIIETSNLEDIYYEDSRDNIFLNTSYETIDFIGDDSILTKKWYLDIYVENEDGYSVDGASVDIYDKDGGSSIISSLTNNEGYVRQELIEYVQEDSSSYDYSTPHTIVINHEDLENSDDYNSSEIDLRETNNTEHWVVLDVIVDVPPSVILDSPDNEEIFGYESVDFECSASDSHGLKNITFNLWNFTGGLVYDSYEAVSGTINSSSFSKSFNLEENYEWNCLVYDNSGKSSWANNNKTIAISQELISIISPQNKTYNISAINFTVSGSKELSYCRVSLDEGTTNYTLVVNNTKAYYKKTGMVDGNYKAEFWCNDSLGEMENIKEISFSVGLYAPPGSELECDSENPSLCETELDCEIAEGYWYDDSCNEEEEVVQSSGDISDLYQGPNKEASEEVWEKNKEWDWILYLQLGIGVLIILGIILFYVFKKSKSKTGSNLGVQPVQNAPKTS